MKLSPQVAKKNYTVLLLRHKLLWQNYKSKFFLTFFCKKGHWKERYQDKTLDRRSSFSYPISGCDSRFLFRKFLRVRVTYGENDSFWFLLRLQKAVLTWVVISGKGCKVVDAVSSSILKKPSRERHQSTLPAKHNIFIRWRWFWRLKKKWYKMKKTWLVLAHYLLIR